jgi:importin-7
MEHFVRLLEIIASPPSHADMKAAEDHITQAKFQPGFSVMILQLVVSQSVSVPVRVLAAILFKQTVDDQWNKAKGTQGPPEIPEADKNIIRENALQSLLHCHPQVSKQLQEAVKTIILNDWPKRWPNLIPTVFEVLKTQQNPLMLEGALSCYLAVIKKSEWKEKEREQMYNLIQETFPFLLEFMSHIRTIQTEESYRLQKTICKCFYASFHLKMPPYLRQENILSPWLTKFMEILMSPLPQGEPTCPTAKAEWAPWKAKKWAMHIFQRLFSRFGDPLFSSKNSKKVWAKNFSKNYGTKILEGILKEIFYFLFLFLFFFLHL